MDAHDKGVAIAVVSAIIAVCITIAVMTLGSFVTNSNTQKACINASGSWTTSPGNHGKSCILTK